MTIRTIQTNIDKLLSENPDLAGLISQSRALDGFRNNLRQWLGSYIKSRPHLKESIKTGLISKENFEKFDWKDLAAMRMSDYLEYAGLKVEDPGLGRSVVKSDPFGQLYLSIKTGEFELSEDFVRDMIMLFRQYSGKLKQSLPSREKVMEWTDRHPSGLDPEIVDIRRKNRDRILHKFMKMIDDGRIKDSKFSFEPGMKEGEKYSLMLEWWDSRLFHLRFAIRDPEILNEMLDHSVPEEQMELLRKAKKKGIPTFVNPYYLSFLLIDPPEHLKGADEAIREYIFYSQELIEEFGNIAAWEKEDLVEPGKPNAAGWLLPSSHSLHRRYPEVAILIPNNVGRACAGLCSSCQRMYDFQRGNLNFNLEKLKPKTTWPEQLAEYMDYFRNDSQLRDILITGGDALMAVDKSMKLVLDAVYDMARNKIEDNKKRPQGEKYAEMRRIRMGTRLLAYLPQRITDELAAILADFRTKAMKIGMTQFVIQTHFESAMEVTPEARDAIGKLNAAGWIVTNQLVFTAGASRRGHTNKLRQVLNEVGVLPYYTFTVKGYKENAANFATNARAVQEQVEEKAYGALPDDYLNDILNIGLNAGKSIEIMANIMDRSDLPFLALDRNVLNLPGVGKSLTFRTIGITPSGKRVLLFDHDHTRRHSPIIEKMGRVTIVESKSIGRYLRQLEAMGEDITDYESIYGYSVSQTEKVMPVYQYPGYDFGLTDEMTNLEV